MTDEIHAVCFSKYISRLDNDYMNNNLYCSYVTVLIKNYFLVTISENFRHGYSSEH